jgi:hypothetical protein
MTILRAMEFGTEPPTAVYRFYAADGALLYVGITKNLHCAADVAGGTPARQPQRA